ncbi:MAG TPA: DNA repair protein RadC [Candidatus Paceibacterota bacterium]|nr:DNA repair protein RadC [Candidatus Paceibacterota bacterium]
MQNMYTTIDHTLILADSAVERRYVLKVRDLPKDEKPREKLLRYGPSALSAAELLAVVLSVGTKKEEVLVMANRILKDYGMESMALHTNPKELAADLDIPIGKAMQVISSLELGRRFFRRNANGAPIIRTARDVFEYAADMRTLPKEHLRGIYLNAHYKVIHDETISIGTIDASIIHPREVFKPALEYSAAAVVLVHNHPSGIVEPSEADIAITTQLISAGKLLGIDLIDHVIVAGDAFKSIPAPYTGGM